MPVYENPTAVPPAPIEGASLTEEEDPAKVTHEVKHLYGLGYAETSDTSLSESWKFLSTRASIFNKPSIGDNFIATLAGKDAVARVKAFNELFAGADNTAIGTMGESIAKDVLRLLGAKGAVKHPTHTVWMTAVMARGSKWSSARSAGAG